MRGAPFSSIGQAGEPYVTDIAQSLARILLEAASQKLALMGGIERIGDLPCDVERFGKAQRLEVADALSNS